MRIKVNTNIMYKNFVGTVCLKVLKVVRIFQFLIGKMKHFRKKIIYKIINCKFKIKVTKTETITINKNSKCLSENSLAKICFRNC